jgi:sulfite reductase (NADPH) flavoprotein alpha-component
VSTTVSAPPSAPPVIALLPEDAPFTREQRAWLNGFFAGLLTQLATRSAPALAPKLKVPVLYASQTGTAESLSRKLAKEARAKGFDAQAVELGSLTLEALSEFKHAVFIASTHGEGDPPDSALVFALQLDAAQTPKLAGLKYAVLALGDRTYAKFCGFGRLLDERFAALGATRLLDRIEADTAVDEPFRIFRDRLWPELLKEAPAAQATPSGAVAAEAADDDPPEERWSRERPCSAVLRSKLLLTGRGSDKEVRHIVLSLAGSELHYEPGDALGVWPCNAPELVARILALTALAPDAPVSVGGTVLPLAEALSVRVEIAKLGIPTAIKFAAVASDAEVQSLVEPDHAAALEAFLFGRDAVDLLARAPGAIADAQTLVDLFPPLAPRLYSIASSLAVHPQQMHLTVSVLRHARDGRQRGGVASTHLADRIDPEGTLPVYVHRNPRFRLPADPGVPLIMIGPGTGIAPFRSFLWHRKAHGYTGRTWLFFGDRRAHCDYLYREELAAFLDDGTLSRLDACFSRDQERKIYVQHRMLESGSELWQWIQDGANIYVCGDATRMAKDVDAALQRIFVDHGGLSAAKAQLELRTLGASGRYLRDVY